MRRLPLERYIEGVLSGDRIVLARAITIVESHLPADGELAARLLDALLPHTGGALRVGITGVPGVGKSTFIDALGMHLIRDRGENVAVLSVDPSSPISGGSILGDKTRMERLAVEERAFIRPSPARGHLGDTAIVTLPDGRRARYVVLDRCPRSGIIDLPSREYRHWFGRHGVKAGRIRVRVRFEHHRAKHRHALKPPHE